MKETNEDAQELADERVRGIMDVYEQRIERIQRKVDEDDEWVSSLLYHQEQLKVQVCVYVVCIAIHTTVTSWLFDLEVVKNVRN